MKKWGICLLILLALAGGFLLRTDAQIPEQVRIGLTREFGNRESIPINSAQIIVGYGVDGVFIPVLQLESAAGFAASVNASLQVVLHAGGNVVFTFDRERGEPQIMGADGGPIQLGTRTYRSIIALRAVDRRLTAINIVCPEEYLFGVIPSEMSPGWHPQALKAQAVAARTFLYRRTLEGRHTAQSFHLCDTTCCQSYLGIGAEHANTTAAVLATRGVMIFYNDAPILAAYFSSGGGATDNSENVWVQVLPYLRSVNSIAEYRPREWVRSFTWAELTSLANNENAHIGTVNGVAITEVGASGRVQELTLFGTNGHLVLNGDRTRSFFSPMGGMLDSRNYRILEALPQLPAVWVYDGRQLAIASLGSHMGLDKNGLSTPMHMAYVFDGITTRRITAPTTTVTGGTGITIVGSGWGHGVGMSQHGAQGMALRGFSYRDILHHYYTGVEIR